MRFFLGAILTILPSLLVGCLKIEGPKAVKSTGEVKAPLVDYHEFFPNETTLNQVISVLTHAGNIYIGTKKGLYAYSLGDWDPLNANSPFLKGEKVTRLAISSSSHLFAVTEERGLYVLYPGETKFHHTGSTLVRDIAVLNGTNRVYCATSHGVDIFEDGRWSNQSLKATSEYAANPNDIQAIALQGKAVIWLGTSFGVYRMKNATEVDFLMADFQIIQGNSVIDRKGNSPLGGNLIYDIDYNEKDNNLIFATNGGVSIISDPEQYKDANNWQTFTGNHTISRMSSTGVSEFPVPGNSPLPTNFVMTAVKLGKSLYFGTEKGLIHLKNNDWKVYNLENYLPGDVIYDLHTVNSIDEEILYIGTSGGLAIIKEPKHQSQEGQKI